MNNWLDAIESLEFTELPGNIIRFTQDPEPGVTWLKCVSYSYKDKPNPLQWGAFLTENGWQVSYLPYHPKPNVYAVAAGFEIAEKIILMMLQEGYIPPEMERC